MIYIGAGVSKTEFWDWSNVETGRNDVIHLFFCTNKRMYGSPVKKDL